MKTIKISGKKNKIFFLIVFMSFTIHGISQSLGRFEKMVRMNYNLNQLKVDIEKDYKLVEEGENDGSGNISFFYEKPGDSLTFNLDVLYSKLFNRLTAIRYTDKLEKLPVLMKYVENSLGYKFVQKNNIRDNQGSLTGEVGYGYRKSNILIIFQTGTYENMLLIRIINESIK